MKDADLRMMIMMHMIHQLAGGQCLGPPHSMVVRALVRAVVMLPQVHLAFVNHKCVPLGHKDSLEFKGRREAVWG